MKFLVPNYSCLQNPWLGGYHPQIPILSVLNWICWNPPPPKKKNSWVHHWLHLAFLRHHLWPEVQMSTIDMEDWKLYVQLADCVSHDVLAKFIINKYLCNLNLILQLERWRESVTKHLQCYMTSKDHNLCSCLNVYMKS